MSKFWELVKYLLTRCKCLYDFVEELCGAGMMTTMPIFIWMMNDGNESNYIRKTVEIMYQ